MGAGRTHFGTLVDETFDVLRSTEFEAFASPGSRANARVLSVVVGGTLLLFAPVHVLATVPIARSQGASPGLMLLIGSLVGLTGLLLLLFQRTVPIWLVDAQIATATLALVLVAPRIPHPVQAYVAHPLVWLGLIVCMLRPGTPASVHIAWMAVAYTLHTPSDDLPDPMYRSALVATSMIVVGMIGGWLLDRARRLAVAERRARQQAEFASRELGEVSRTKTDFLAQMSHELRTPLNAVTGMAEMLDRQIIGPLNDRQQIYVHDIVESSHHLLGLVEGVLDLPRIEQGRVEVAFRPLEISSVLERARAILREGVQTAGVDLDIDAGAAGEIVGDEGMLRQVVVNLLSNAIKFTPPGGSIRVTATRQGDHVLLTVADDGPGVAPADRARIFDNFQQVDSRRDAPRGSGLGLPLTRRHVELHGGRIWVESEPGHGARFLVELPTAPPSEPLAAEPEGAAIANSPSFDVDPLVPLPVVARIGSGMGLALGAACFGGILTEAPEFDRSGAGIGGFGALLMAAWLVLRAERITRWEVDIIAVGAILGISFGAALGGDLEAFPPLAYLAMITVTFSVRALPVSRLYFVLVCLSYAVVVATDGRAAPVSRWLVIVGGSVLCSLLVRWLLRRTHEIAEAERRARRQAELLSTELGRVSRHKAEFIAGMSHELRTPLNAIIGLADVLCTELAGPLATARQRQYVEDIAGAGRQLLALINDILDLSKLDAGQVAIDPVELDPTTVVRRVIDRLHEPAVARSVTVEIEGDRAPETIVADEFRLEQVLSAIIGNAIRFSPSGRKVTVSIGAADDVATISVQDRGPGIVPEKQIRIFEEFQAFDDGPTRAREGVGLGLALARRIALFHGGNLAVASTPGLGAKFTLSLPNSAAYRAEAMALASPAFGWSRA